MPTPKQQPSRVPVFLLLVGVAGCVASGWGLFPLVFGWGFLALVALGAVLPLLGTRAETQAFDSEERLANDRARESMKWAVDRQDRLLKDLGDAVAEMQKNALQPGEAPEMRRVMTAFAADLQIVKQEVVDMKEAENRRRFGTTLRGEPEST